MLLHQAYVDGISSENGIYRNMMQPAGEPVCKPSQVLPICPDSDSKAHDLYSFTYMKNMSKVVELYFQGRSLVLKENVPWKLSSGKCHFGMNPKFSG